MSKSIEEIVYEKYKSKIGDKVKIKREYERLFEKDKFSILFNKSLLISFFHIHIGNHFKYNYYASFAGTNKLLNLKYLTKITRKRIG